MNDLIHKAGVLTVCRAKWALNCVSNKSVPRVNRGKRVWEGKEVSMKRACHGDLAALSNHSVRLCPPGHH